MASAISPYEAYDSTRTKDFRQPQQKFQAYEQECTEKQTNIFGTREWEDMTYLSSDYDFYQEQSFVKGVPLLDNQQLTSEFLMMDDMQLHVVSSVIQELQEPVQDDGSLDLIQKLPYVNTPEILESKKKKVYSSPMTSLQLLNIYGTGHRILNRENFNVLPKEVTSCGGRRELSTEEVMRVASAHYIQLREQTGEDLLILRHPFSSMLPNLTGEETKDVELAHLLLASSEKIGFQQYERASKLLMQCEDMSCNNGNPVQRVVYYFAKALREKIDRESGRLSSKGITHGRWGEDIEEKMMDPHPAVLACYQMLPFGRVIQFTAMQSIIDDVASAKRVHLVDLGIKIGLQWTILMQALVERTACPVEILKISAVGTSQKKIEDTGKRLVSFAKTLNIPFEFKPVIVSAMKDLNRDLFEVDAEEMLGVYAPMALNFLISKPDELEHLMRVIRSLKPSIMVVTEVDANHNSPSFFKRFTEALFFFSAWFDCFDTFMDRDDSNRMHVESKFFSPGIQSIVAAEDSERIVRHAAIDVWRSFFIRFGFVEIELNHLSLYQASLIAKEFTSGSSFTFEMNGKALSIGWKGTPLHFVSAWRLKSDRT